MLAGWLGWVPAVACPSLLCTTAAHRRKRLGGRERLTLASLSRCPPVVNRSDLVKVSDIPGISDYREFLVTMHFVLAGPVK
jgi:hypothetical protein